MNETCGRNEGRIHYTIYKLRYDFAKRKSFYLLCKILNIKEMILDKFINNKYISIYYLYITIIIILLKQNIWQIIKSKIYK